jgi:glycerate kinase
VARQLEQALQHFADVTERTLAGGPWRDKPGTGAGGGLGFALLAFTGARVTSGANLVADLVGFDPVGADVVITGEGCLDRQTATGKVADFVLMQSLPVGAKVVALVGSARHGAGSRFDHIAVLGRDGLLRPRELLQARAEQMARRVSRTR